MQEWSFVETKGSYRVLARRFSKGKKSYRVHSNARTVFLGTKRSYKVQELFPMHHQWYFKSVNLHEGTYKTYLCITVVF